MTPQVYRVPPAIFAPALLALVAIGMGIAESWWSLLAIPFIWLGSICAAPNLNLADGCLAILAMGIGLGVICFYEPLGKPILFGTLAAYYLSALEKGIRMRPYNRES